MFHSALYVVDLKKFRKIAAGDRLRGQYQGLSQDPNSLSNLDQVCLHLIRPKFTDAPTKNKNTLLVSGSAQQHDSSGPHQVSASGVALVWDLVWRPLQKKCQDDRPGKNTLSRCGQQRRRCCFHYFHPTPVLSVTTRWPRSPSCKRPSGSWPSGPTTTRRSNACRAECRRTPTPPRRTKARVQPDAAGR